MSNLPNRIQQHLDGHSGTCGSCRWWQTDANADAGHDPTGLCLHEELAHFELEVSADSGCNRFRFEPAAAATAAVEDAPYPT